MNSNALIAGFFADMGQQVHGFLRPPGEKYRLIDHFGALLTRTVDVNDVDDAVGWFTDAQKIVHGLLR